MNDVNNLRVPSFCPICGMVMKGSKSTSAFYDWGCCSACFIEWIEDRESKWKDGWRPTKEQIERFVGSF